MKTTELLHSLGQSLWLDNITRDLLNQGTLKRYIDELSVTGLTSNPTIFDGAIKNSTAYDAAIHEGLEQGKAGEDLFFDLAIADLTRAAGLFRPIFDRTNGVDGWVSLEAFADHGEPGSSMAADGGSGEEVIGEFAQAGVNVDARIEHQRRRNPIAGRCDVYPRLARFLRRDGGITNQRFGRSSPGAADAD